MILRHLAKTAYPDDVYQRSLLAGRLRQVCRTTRNDPELKRLHVTARICHHYMRSYQANKGHITVMNEVVKLVMKPYGDTPASLFVPYVRPYTHPWRGDMVCGLEICIQNSDDPGVPFVTCTVMFVRAGIVERVSMLRETGKEGMLVIIDTDRAYRAFDPKSNVIRGLRYYRGPAKTCYMAPYWTQYHVKVCPRSKKRSRIHQPLTDADRRWHTMVKRAKITIICDAEIIPYPDTFTSSSSSEEDESETATAAVIQ